MGSLDTDLAHATDVCNTIPSDFVDIAVTTSAAVHDLAAAPLGLGGKRVRFRAQGGDITVLAGDHTGGSPLTAGAGLVLADGVLSERFFIPQESPLPLTVIAGSALTLRVFYDA